LGDTIQNVQRSTPNAQGSMITLKDSRASEAERFRQKRTLAASLEERIKSSMNNETTYALLIRSEEKGRSIMETVVYALCIMSAAAAIWQFALQPTPSPFDGNDSPAQAAPTISHHSVEAELTKNS
jgi:hypothetical protein